MGAPAPKQNTVGGKYETNNQCPWVQKERSEILDKTIPARFAKPERGPLLGGICSIHDAKIASMSWLFC
jgi:hypothetical protein